MEKQRLKGFYPMTDYRIKVFEIKTEKNTFHVYLRKNKVIDITENGYFVPFQAREMTYLSLWGKVKYAIWEVKWLARNRLRKRYIESSRKKKKVGTGKNVLNERIDTHAFIESMTEAIRIGLKRCEAIR